MNTRGSVLAWLGHPVTVVAVVVLAMNDHLLKAAHPGVITGKLSDVAGLVFAPALLAALVGLALPRLPARAVAVGSLIATGVGFGLTKATAQGAEIASAAWSLVWPSHILADRTDLLALPALGVAWWVWCRTCEAPVPDRAVRLFRVGVILPLAVLAVAATSPAWHPAVTRVSTAEGKLVADNYTSVDGRTWTLAGGSVERSRDEVYDPPATPVTHACVPAEPAHCFRTVPRHLAVEETMDGGRSWRRAWEVTDSRRQFLLRQDREERATVADYRSVEVAVLPVADGFLVAVANLHDGMALRQADGRWERLGVPSLGVPAGRLTAPGRYLLPEHAWGLLIGALALLVAMQAAASRRPGLVGGMAVLIVLGLAVTHWGATVPLGPMGPVLMLPGLGLSALAVIPWWFGMVGDRATRPWHVLLAGLLGLATAVGVVFPFYGWSAGEPDDYGAAVKHSMVGAAVGLTLSVGLAGVMLYRRWLARRAAHSDAASV